MPTQDALFFSTLSDGILSRARAYAKEDARAFRAEAIRILARAIFEYAPFSDAADLITSYGAESETDDGADEEPKVKGGKKKKKGDVQLSLSLLTIYISIFQDALNEQLGLRMPRNSDQSILINKIASHFTTTRIQGIIEMLSNAQQKLTAGASVYLTLDSVLARLFAYA